MSERERGGERVEKERRNWREKRGIGERGGRESEDKKSEKRRE